jgi:hypothetical protein
VLALGYNGFLPGFKPPEDFYADWVKRVSHIIHAETNALVYVPRGKAGLIAVTLAPCAGCARAIHLRRQQQPILGTSSIRCLRSKHQTASGESSMAKVPPGGLEPKLSSIRPDGLIRTGFLVGTDRCNR